MLVKSQRVTYETRKKRSVQHPPKIDYLFLNVLCVLKLFFACALQKIMNKLMISDLHYYYTLQLFITNDFVVF